MRDIYKSNMLKLVTQHIPHVQRELFTLQQHLSSFPVQRELFTLQEHLSSFPVQRELFTLQEHISSFPVQRELFTLQEHLSSFLVLMESVLFSVFAFVCCLFLYLYLLAFCIYLRFVFSSVLLWSYDCFYG